MAIPGHLVQKNTYEFNYDDRKKKQQLSRWEQYRKFLWNPETNEVLERPFHLWGYSLLFYSIFYLVLAILIAIYFKAFFWLRIDLKKPAYMLEESLIGTNPGLGFRPMPEDIEKGSLILYDMNDQASIDYWVDMIDKYLAEYDQNQAKSKMLNRVPCDSRTTLVGDQVCDVKMADFHECSRKTSYGFRNGSPCIFLKLNRIFGWVPDYYKKGDELPKEMPSDLQSIINNTDVKNVWVSCEGENPADKEHIGSKISYHPDQGFASYYYPFVNGDGYLSPLVAVKFNHPTTNVLINIECRAWAKNINYFGTKNRQGSVHFELQIDKP